jgi:hypothetical protein
LRPDSGDVVVVDDGWSSSGSSLPADTKLTSFLVHFDPVAAMGATGSITFSHPIIGVILDGDKLGDSDPVLASIGRLPDQDRSILSNGSGVLGFSGDLRTLQVNLTSLELDVIQLRVLTEAVFALPEAGIGGDYSGDGVIDIADYTVWRDSVGSINLEADGNGDGTIDIEDYVVWKGNHAAEAGGDYNGNGAIDAADYVVWRDGGSPNDSFPGYNLWKANYGNSGGSSGGTIPEPSTVTLALMLLLLGFALQRARG